MKPIVPTVRTVSLHISSADYKRLILLARKAPEGAAVYFATQVNDTPEAITIWLNNMVVPPQKVCRKKQLPTISNEETGTVFLLDSADTYIQKLRNLRLKTQMMLKGTKYKIELTDLTNGLVYETTDINLEIDKTTATYDVDVYDKDLANVVDLTPKVKKAATLPWTKTTQVAAIAPKGYTTATGDYQGSIFDTLDYDYDF